MPREEHGTAMGSIAVLLRRGGEGEHRQMVPGDDQVIGAHLAGGTSDAEVGCSGTEELLLEQLHSLDIVLPGSRVIEDVASYYRHLRSPLRARVRLARVGNPQETYQSIASQGRSLRRSLGWVRRGNALGRRW